MSHEDSVRRTLDHLEKLLRERAEGRPEDAGDEVQEAGPAATEDAEQEPSFGHGDDDLARVDASRRAPRAPEERERPGRSHQDEAPWSPPAPAGSSHEASPGDTPVEAAPGTGGSQGPPADPMESTLEMDAADAGELARFMDSHEDAASAPPERSDLAPEAAAPEEREHAGPGGDDEPGAHSAGEQPAARSDASPAVPEDEEEASAAPAARLNGNGGRPYRRLTARLGTLLLDEGLLSIRDLEKALENQRATGERLGHYLVDQGLVAENDLVRVLSDQYGIPAADLEATRVEPEVLALIPVEMARRYLIVPLSRHESALSVAMVDPTDVVAIANIKFATGLRPQPLIATERAVQVAIARLYGLDDRDAASPLAEPEESSEPEEIERVIRRMILGRDEQILAVGDDPRAAFHLAAVVDDFVDELIRKVREATD